MSFMRAMSSGVMDSTAPVMRLTYAVEHLLAQLLDQLLEALLGLGRGEVVALQLAHHAGQVGRQHLELHVALVGRALGGLGPARVAGLGAPRGPGGRSRRARPAPPRAAPRRSRRRRRRGRSGRAAPGARWRSRSSRSRTPCDVLALPVAEALLQQPAQRGVQVAVVEQVVGDLLEHRVGVEVEADLRAVPAAVAEPRRRHGATVSAGGAPAPGLGDPREARWGDRPGRAGRAGPGRCP